MSNQIGSKKPLRSIFMMFLFGVSLTSNVFQLVGPGSLQPKSVAKGDKLATVGNGDSTLSLELATETMASNHRSMVLDGTPNHTTADKDATIREENVASSKSSASNPNVASTLLEGDLMPKDDQKNASSTSISTYPAAAAAADVMIQMMFSRHDRLGSNIIRPLQLMAYAHCHGYAFCIQKGSQRLSKYFSPGFGDVCPDANPYNYSAPLSFQSPPNKTGLYTFRRDDKALDEWFKANEDCAFDDDMRAKWGQMIMDASYSRHVVDQEAGEELFQNMDYSKTVTVAVNIRRGDFVQWRRKAIPDEFYVVLIRKLRSMITKSGRVPQVHIFSEDYGMIDAKRNISANWGLYNGIEDHFHLAPDLRTEKNAHNMDMALNLRDWRNFVKADVLVVGGTFSKLPGLGRPKNPDPKTGLPLTIHPCVHDCGDKTSYQYGWSKYSYGPMPDKLKLVNLPEAFSKFDDNKTDFYEDLLVHWNVTHNGMQEDATNNSVSLSAEKKSAVQKKRKENKSVVQKESKVSMVPIPDMEPVSDKLTSLETSWKLLDDKCLNNTSHDEQCIQKFPSVFQGAAAPTQSGDLDTQQVTLVTHCAASLDKLRTLATQATQWGGPVSAAIYIRKAEDVSQLIAFIEESPNNWTNKIAFHTMMESFHGEWYQGYPHNRLRNLALDEALTDYVLLMDVDFMTSPNAHRNMVSLMQQDTEMLDMLQSKKFVFALPPFDVVPAPGKEVADPVLLPQSKQEVLAGLTNQTIVPFYEKTNKGSHKFHQYENWKEYPAASNPRYYKVSHTRDAEPYVLAYRPGLPSYCEELRGYGYNKVSYFWSLNYIGYKFAVLQDFYVSHLHHPLVPRKDMRRGVNRNKPMYGACQARVKELYAKTTAVADAGMSSNGLPIGKSEGSHHHDGQEKKTGRQNVSLVTSFFADSVFTLTNPTTSTTKKAHHLHEISAAILKNIHNPYFAQVVVILDGARDEANCNHFREYLESMEKELLEWGREHANITILHDALMHGQSQQKLTCVNREQGQPNYYEMFQYATNSNTTSRIVTSPIVVLENADHVFDETLIWAGSIKPNAVLTLPSHGYNKNLTPPEVAAYFQFANRNHSDWDTLKKKLIPDRCSRGCNSWDGYIFHQDYVRGTLDATDFRRSTNINTTAFFNMNELGAENAALWALLKNLPDGTHSANGCDFIKTWHYHAAPKMHMHHRAKARGFEWTPGKRRVPVPWRKSKVWQGDNAFVVDLKTTKFML